MDLLIAQNKRGYQVSIFLINFSMKTYVVGTIALDQALFFHQKVSIFFLFLDKNIPCGGSHESPKYRNTTEILEYPWKI